jgi:hypothetical protein
MRIRSNIPAFSVTIIALIAAIALVALPAGGEGNAGQSETDLCRKDLAARLEVNLKEIGVSSIKPMEFPDTSLGLPRPGEVYAQVITPGLRIILELGNQGYLYTASGQSIRYGGPLGSWACSALYIEPVAGEPNLNGSLVQISLAGTSPEIILRGVNGFYPQADGSVIATRRTSRSGHDLLYLAQGAQDMAITLASAFIFGDAVINSDVSRWAAFGRLRVGTPWIVFLGNMGGSGSQASVPLPVESAPSRIYWTGPLPVIGLKDDGKITYWELADSREWRKLDHFVLPDADLARLNKSETLEVKQETSGGKQSVKVARVWFTGDEKVLAVIPGLSLERFFIAPSLSYVLITGQMGGRHAARTVDLHTGEVLETITGTDSEPGLLPLPPRAAKELR